MTGRWIVGYSAILALLVAVVVLWPPQRAQVPQPLPRPERPPHPVTIYTPPGYTP